jgi:hypothetical protein
MSFRQLRNLVMSLKVATMDLKSLEQLKPRLRYGQGPANNRYQLSISWGLRGELGPGLFRHDPSRMRIHKAGCPQTLDMKLHPW